MLTDLEKRIFGLGYVLAYRHCLVKLDDIPSKIVLYGVHLSGLKSFKKMGVSDDMDIDKYHELLKFEESFRNNIDDEFAKYMVSEDVI